MGIQNRTEVPATTVLVNTSEDYYDIKVQDTKVGKLRLKKFPYCSALCILCDMEILEAHRGKGYAQKAIAAAEIRAKELRFRMLLCTDVETNIPMRKALLKKEWQDILVFRNYNTDNIVNLSYKKL